ncbi:YggT family protein [Candidatus Peregrinibacteria bacterium]|nr:YggT family protein [Candidatus Peregrinibacteria bacterium]
MAAVFLINFVSIFFDLLSFAIIARILMSWISNGGSGQIQAFLRSVTEPILSPFRRAIPRLGMFDISPIVALFCLDLLRGLLINILQSLFL